MSYNNTSFGRNVAIHSTFIGAEIAVSFFALFSLHAKLVQMQLK